MNGAKMFSPNIGFPFFPTTGRQYCCKVFRSLPCVLIKHNLGSSQHQRSIHNAK